MWRPGSLVGHAGRRRQPGRPPRDRAAFSLREADHGDPRKRHGNADPCGKAERLVVPRDADDDGNDRLASTGMTFTTPMAAPTRLAYRARNPATPKSPARTPAKTAAVLVGLMCATTAIADTAAAPTKDHRVACSALALRELTPPAKSDAPQKTLATSESSTPSIWQL